MDRYYKSGGSVITEYIDVKQDLKKMITLSICKISRTQCFSQKLAAFVQVIPNHPGQEKHPGDMLRLPDIYPHMPKYFRQLG